MKRLRRQREGQEMRIIAWDTFLLHNSVCTKDLTVSYVFNQRQLYPKGRWVGQLNEGSRGSLFIGNYVKFSLNQFSKQFKPHKNGDDVFWVLVFGFPLSDFYWMKIEIEKSCLCITSSQLSCSLSDQVVKYIDLFSFPFLAFFILFLNEKIK